MSQTPLYDQLRDERINADVVVASDTEVSAPQAQQEPLRPPGLHLVADEGPGAVGGRGVSSGLGVEPECFGRHHRHDEAPDLHGGAGGVLSAQVLRSLTVPGGGRPTRPRTRWR